MIDVEFLKNYGLEVSENHKDFNLNDTWDNHIFIKCSDLGANNVPQIVILNKSTYKFERLVLCFDTRPYYFQKGNYSVYNEKDVLNYFNSFRRNMALFNLKVISSRLGNITFDSSKKKTPEPDYINTF